MDSEKDSRKEIDLDSLKKKIKSELKKELLAEIYRELRSEEKEPEVIAELTTKETVVIDKTEEVPVKTEVSRTTENIQVTVKAFLKFASHALKYANSNIPRDEWVEVIGLLAGKIDGDVLVVEDAYPMGHGSAIFAEIKDYKNYVRAFNDIKKKNLFICGWYHSHPSYGLFMSTEDFGTQARYQKLWNRSIALVVDPYMINGKKFGFDIFRANIKSRKWYAVPFEIKGSIGTSALPGLLEFLNPLVEGKALYLEYDE